MEGSLNNHDYSSAINSVVFFLLLACSLIVAKSAGDPVVAKLESQSASVQIAGSSSLHDWTEKSHKATAEAIFIINS